MSAKRLFRDAPVAQLLPVLVVGAAAGELDSFAFVAKAELFGELCHPLLSPLIQYGSFIACRVVSH